MRAVVVFVALCLSFCFSRNAGRTRVKDPPNIINFPVELEPSSVQAPEPPTSNVEVVFPRAPFVFALSEYLTEQECAQLIEMCSKRFEGKVCTLKEGENELVESVEKRVAESARSFVRRLEALEVVKYDPHEVTEAVVDWFDVKDFENQRYKSLFVFLNDGKGSEIRFDEKGVDVQMESDTGLGVLWYNCYSPENPHCFLDSKYSIKGPRNGIQYILRARTRFSSFRVLKQGIVTANHEVESESEMNVHEGDRVLVHEISDDKYWAYCTNEGNGESGWIPSHLVPDDLQE